MTLTSLIDGRLMASLTRLFTDTVTIQRATEDTDAEGGLTGTWANLVDCVDLTCAITPRGQNERRTPVQVYAEATTVIILASTTTSVQPRDRAVGSDGNTYDILGTVTDSIGLSTELLCRLVTL